MRETIVRLYCDAHAAEGERTEASHTREITLDGFPAKTLDLCERCDKELFDRLIVLIDAHGVAVEGARKEPPRQATVACEICGDEMQRHSLTSHLNGKKHLAGRLRRPSNPCEVCGASYDRQMSLTNHMIRAHGFDTLADAYAQARAEARA